MTTIPFFVNYSGNRVLVGKLRPDGTFSKSVRREQKLMALNAYGFDNAYMADVLNLGCKAIELREIDTNITYRISIADFIKFSVNRSIGKFATRMYVPLQYWDIAAVS